MNFSHLLLRSNFYGWDAEYLFVSKNRESHNLPELNASLVNKRKNTADYKQVTKAFQDVFSSSHPSVFTYNDEMKQDIELEKDRSYIGRQQPKC